MATRAKKHQTCIPFLVLITNMFILTQVPFDAKRMWKLLPHLEPKKKSDPVYSSPTVDTAALLACAVLPTSDPGHSFIASVDSMTLSSSFTSCPLRLVLLLLCDTHSRRLHYYEWGIYPILQIGVHPSLRP